MPNGPPLAEVIGQWQAVLGRVMASYPASPAVKARKLRTRTYGTSRPLE
jgi:hypothetical protein